MLIKIKVKVNARKEEITRKGEDQFIISVKEKAERNEANSRILKIFRKLYPRKSVRIVKGHRSPGKIVEVGSAG